MVNNKMFHLFVTYRNNKKPIAKVDISHPNPPFKAHADDSKHSMTL